MSGIIGTSGPNRGGASPRVGVKTMTLIMT